LDNIETSETGKAPGQLIGWNPGRGQWKLITDNSMTQISETNSNKTEKRNQTILEKSLDELEPIQMEDEVKNVLVTIINLVINSGNAKAMVRHMWEAVELHTQHYNKIQR
jgi:ABC-type oligopeptide transport system ATPase subunit